jgi:ribonuclease VapC
VRREATPTVLDSSALVAVVRHEAGRDKVAAVLRSSVVAAPNWAEMLEVLAKKGYPSEVNARRFKTLGVTVEPVTEDDAETAARLALRRANRDLSLGDRFCLALAQRLKRPAYTAERGWAKVDADADVVLIR